MILHWNEIILHYGNSAHYRLLRYEHRFTKLPRSSFGVLFSPVSVISDDDPTLNNRAPGLHAEERLLRSDAWKSHIPTALNSRFAGHKPFKVVIALTRSPCRSCTEQLIEAISVARRHTKNSRFILACMGFYGPSRMQPGAPTQVKDLKRLIQAGWELATLQVGAKLTLNGQMLEHQLMQFGYRGMMHLK